jgi:hypothetical protein
MAEALVVTCFTRHALAMRAAMKILGIELLSADRTGSENSVIDNNRGRRGGQCLHVELLLSSIS